MHTDVGGKVHNRSTTVRRILVPVDCSEWSGTAVDYAAMIANQFEAAVDVLHVWHPDDTNAIGKDALARFARTPAGHTMEDLLESLDRTATVPPHGRLAVGEPAAAIVAVAKTDHYDLIVLATSSRRGLHRLLHAGVAGRVVRDAPCPVLVVSPATSPRSLASTSAASEAPL